MIRNLLVFNGARDYDDYCSFQVSVSSANISNSISFFGYADALQSFGRQLVDFSSDVQRRVCFQQGEAATNQEYLLLEAYYLDWLGHAALRVIMDNKAAPPAEVRMAFSLTADVASLVELGRKLLSWQLQVGPPSSVEWRPVVS